MRIDSKSDLRQMARKVLSDNNASPSDSACNGFSNQFSKRLRELNIEYEVSSGGVFLGADIIEHTWVVVDADSAKGELSGIFLVDGTVMQFAEAESDFNGVAVLGRDDPRWPRWYAQESESPYDVPNDGRSDIKIP